MLNWKMTEAEKDLIVDVLEERKQDIQNNIRLADDQEHEKLTEELRTINKLLAY